MEGNKHVRDRKRKKSSEVPVPNETEDKKKPRHSDETETPTVITEIEFKFLLRDSQTTAEGLEKFVASADTYADGACSHDIVAGYCRSSPMCAELFSLIDSASETPAKPSEHSQVFLCLERILTRIRNDLTKHSSLGETIVQKILAGHLGQVYRCLRDQNKSKTIKCALQLLIAMAMLSDKAKKTLQMRLNFEHQSFPPLFKRRNRKDPQDVRSCMVLLTLAFVLDSDSSSTDTLVQQRKFLQMTIGGLNYDSRDMVIDVLETLLDKVVKCPTVTKTAKVKLFSEHILRHLCDLFSWKGPKAWVAGGKKRLQAEQDAAEMEDDEGDDTTEDRELIAEVAHSFLVELCCSRKDGISFYDKTVGTGKRNLNQLLSHFLDALVKQLHNSHVADLVVRISQACPDQVSRVMAHLAPSLLPRWSGKWELHMDFVVSLYSGLPDMSSVINDVNADTVDRSITLAVASVFCLPTAKVASVITQGVKHEDERVRHKVLQLLRVFCTKCVAALGVLSSQGGQGNGATRTKGEEMTESFVAVVLKTLPPPEVLLGCVDKLFTSLTKQEDAEPTAEPGVDANQQAARLLQVLILYQRLSPAVLLDRPRNLTRIIELVTKLPILPQSGAVDGGEEGNLTEDTGSSPQLCLLKLLSDTDMKKVALGREGLLEKLILSATSTKQHRSLTTQLISKILQSVEVLKGHEKELRVWMTTAFSEDNSDDDDDNAGSDVASSTSNVTFLAHCLSSLINNPSPYMDRVVAELQDGEDVVAGRVVASQEDIADILRPEVQEEVERCLREGRVNVGNTGPQLPDLLPFSPLVLVAVDNLQYNKTADESMRRYVSQVLVKLVHCQTWPHDFCTIVGKSSAELCSGVREYLKFWLQRPEMQKNREESVVSSPMPKKLFPHIEQCATLMDKFSSALMTTHFNVSLTSQDVSALSDACHDHIASLAADDRLTALGQTLMYMHQLFVSERQGCVELMQAYCTLAEALYKSIATLPQEHETASQSEKGESLSSTDSRAPRDGEVGQQVCAAGQILLHPVLGTAFLNEVVRKSPGKGKEGSPSAPTSELCCVLSQFLGGVFVQSKNISCDVIPEVYDKYLMEVVRICRQGFASVPTSAQSTILEILKVIGSDMGSPSCSQAFWLMCECEVTQLLTTAGGKSEAGPKKSSPLSPLGRVFVGLLSVWMDHLAGPGRLSESVLFQCDQSPNNGGAVLNGNFQSQRDVRKFRQFFALHGKNCNFDVAKFSVVFQLLNRCQDKELEEVSLRLLQTVPECIETCTDAFLRSFQRVHLLNGTRQKMLAILIQSRPDVCDWCSKLVAEKGKTVSSQNLWWLASSCLQAPGDFLSEAENTGMLRALESVVTGNVERVLLAADPEALTCVNLLIQRSGRGADILREFTSQFTLHPEKATKLHFDVLRSGLCIPRRETNEGLKGLPQRSDFDDVGGVRRISDVSGGRRQAEEAGAVLEACLRQLMCLLGAKSARDSGLEGHVLTLALDLLCEFPARTLDFLPSMWETFVKSSLRSLYTNWKLLRLLSILVPAMYASDVDRKPLSRDGKVLTAHTMFQMCISHTAFLDTLLSAHSGAAKDELVNLLHALCEVEPSCCQTNLTNVLTAAYTATLSLTDQRLLQMLEKFFKAKGSSFECPNLWGKAALEHRSVSDLLGPSLDRQVTVKSVLEQLDPATMRKSLLCFPVLRSQQMAGGAVVEARAMKSRPEAYDPRFLLQLFNQILSEDKLVPVRLFVERDCLSYLLVALSSHDLTTRLLAYKALNDFYRHADGSRCHERLELTFFLDLLNASRSKSGQKLSSVIALFFARVVKLFLYPADPVYMAVFRFLMARPELDLSSVPEFYQLFFSANQQLKSERQWILSLLGDGMRETSDYRMLQKHFIFKVIMSFYDSVLSDHTSRRLVLAVVENACRLKSVAVDLVKNHGLLLWLSALASTLRLSPEQTVGVCDVVHTLWFTLASGQVSSGTPASSGTLSQAKAQPRHTSTVAGKPLKRKTERGTSEGEREEGEGEESEDEASEDEEPMEEETGDSGLEAERVSRDETAHKGRPSVPRATLLEMGLIVKSCLPYLRHLPAGGVFKILQVMESLVSVEQSYLMKDKNVTSKTASENPRLLRSCIFTLSERDSLLLAHAVCKSVGDVQLTKELEETLREKRFLSDFQTSGKGIRESAAGSKKSLTSAAALDTSVRDSDETVVTDTDKTVLDEDVEGLPNPDGSDVYAVSAMKDVLVRVLNVTRGFSGVQIRGKSEQRK